MSQRSVIQVSLQNVNVISSGKNGNDKVLLQDVSAVFQHSRVCAIMGPSGAGKTVMLSILSGQIAALRGMNIKGQIRVNEEVISDMRIMNLIAGFVQQDDMLMGSMKVEEILRMGMRLRRSPESPSTQEMLVQQTLRQLGIQKIHDTFVGSPLQKGISGGERKRVSIGQEIITSSSMLVLDEPTSGLDTFSQLLIGRCLHRISRQGVTIISSLHGPPSEMLDYIDDLLLIAEGRIVYHGEMKRLLDYLNSIGHSCPQYVNPLDFVFLEVLHDKSSDSTEHDRERALRLHSIYCRSEALRRVNVRIHNYVPPGLITPSMLKHRASATEQLKFLLPREFQGYYRTPALLLARLFQTLFLGVFLALVYMNVYGSNSTDAVYQNVQGALFFLVITQLFSSMNNTLTVFYEEKQVFLREYMAGFYSLPSYFTARVAADLPFQIISPILTSFIVYWVIGFKPGFDNFLVFAASLTLLSLCGSAIGLSCSATFGNPGVGAAVASVLLLPLAIYGGFFVNASNSPKWLAWIQWISPPQYAFTALALNELPGRVVNGVPGVEPLDALGVTQRFGIGLNLMFLTIIWLVLLALAFLGLSNIIRRSGLSRYSINQARNKVIKRKGS